VDATPGVQRVEDPDDPRLADYAALTDARLRKRYEHQHGVLIAEGPAPVAALVDSPYPVRSLLVAEPRLGALPDVVARVEAPIYAVPQPVLEQVVRFRLHQGILGCGGRLEPAGLAEVIAGADRLLVLEGLNDHENLGALFRTARALGIGGVLLGPGCADPLYRRSVRVSMGHVLHVPFARATSVAELFSALEAAGVATVALTPSPAASELEAIPAGAGPVALVLGAEGPGLSDAVLGRASYRARIPIDGAVDSLNVAAAGAIACHVLARRAGAAVTAPPAGRRGR